MLNEDKIFNTVYSAIKTVTGKAQANLTPKTKLINDLNIESIDILDILFEIERQLGVSINLAEAFQTQRQGKGQPNQFDLEVGEIAKYILNMKSHE